MCEVYDEGTFVAQCGTWHRLQEVRDEDGGIHDGVDEAVMLYGEIGEHGEARVW